MEYINNLEQWMQVSGFPNYMISSCGRVMNITTFRILRPGINDTTGYLYVVLSSNGESSNKSIHRLVAESFILNLNDLPFVDHKDIYSVNNHISNLRWCNQRENNQNRSKNKNTSSIYKGVCFNKALNKWTAQIQYNGQKIHLGCYVDESEAARAYDRKASELFGIFAKLNF